MYSISYYVLTTQQSVYSNYPYDDVVHDSIEFFASDIRSRASRDIGVVIIIFFLFFSPSIELHSIQFHLPRRRQHHALVLMVVAG